ncbi:hypothetical protein JSY36_10345 [Bacillus sp. H-16]|uniref:hypothetical protein n=1 Tax=Alteribacter salitolerans TaxID=2912333 RepID=UPI0019622D4C|nr:hypothetical protein [Alteribacter salitolerans]MBM7096157.1 hypothetical protein [Alteribacter salitolerans]
MHTYVKRSLSTFLALIVMLIALPVSEVEANTYDWNIYSNSIEYKQTGQSFANRSCGQVNNATQGFFRLPNTSSSQTIASYPIDQRSVELDFGSCSTYGMTHVLARHAPEHFIGNPTPVQSFFNPGRSLGNYEAIIGDIIAQNRTQIANYGFTSNGTVVYGNVSQGSVRLVIKGGKVITMYPSGWGLGERQY